MLDDCPIQHDFHQTCRHIEILDLVHPIHTAHTDVPTELSSVICCEGLHGTEVRIKGIDCSDGIDMADEDTDPRQPVPEPVFTVP